MQDLCKELTALGKIKRQQGFDLIDALAVTATDVAVQEFARHPQVKTIYLDEKCKVIFPLAGEPEKIWGKYRIHAPEVHWKGIRGQNVLVAVLDTGIDLDHPQLRAKIVVEKCSSFIAGEATPYDGNGHGHTLRRGHSE